MVAKKTIRVTVELTNLARHFAKASSIEMELTVGTTFGQIVARLAELYPELVGIIIDPQTLTLLNSNFLIINGEMGDPAFLMEESPQDGDRLTLVSVATGG